jgi:DNA-binding CsgD family transcriptional regulator
VARSLDLADRYATEHFHATTSLHDVVRFGAAPRAVVRARAQAARDGATWWDRVCADHAVACVDRDAASLLDVADRFDRGGLAMEALESAAQAASLAAQGPVGTAAAGRIAKLTLVCGRLRTPAMLAAPAGLTEREHVVARMAAVGESNKDIARRLGTSVRTVGNQLQSVYQKLGVSSRHELEPLVD